jgi:beta-glucanase (GH16 family)
VYGAYFVRSRQTGPGPNEVQLLWPVTNTWPPEIDFNETGASDVKTTETVHWGAQNTMDHGNIQLNMLRWHTWGVVWTPNYVAFIVDGRVWAREITPANIPSVPMDLNLEQRALCTVGRQCPKKNVSMLVDWVAEYIPGTTQSTTTTGTTTSSTSPTSTSTTTSTSTP